MSNTSEKDGHIEETIKRTPVTGVLPEDDLAEMVARQTHEETKVERKELREEPEEREIREAVEKGQKEGEEVSTRPLDTQSTPIPTSDEEDPKDDIKSVKARVLKKLAVAQDMILDKVEAMLTETDPDKQPTLNQLMNALNIIADIRLTQEWTERLKKAIERNPTNLTAPNVPAPLLNRLKGLAGGLRKQNKGDGREGRNKMDGIGPIGPTDLPQD